MSNTLWLTNTISAAEDQQSEQDMPASTFTVTVYFPDLSSEYYEHVIDIVFNDGIVVLIQKNGCTHYYRAKFIKKWTAIKE